MNTTTSYCVDCPNCGPNMIRFEDGEMVPHGCDYVPWTPTNTPLYDADRISILPEPVNPRGCLAFLVAVAVFYTAIVAAVAWVVWPT